MGTVKNNSESILFASAVINTKGQIVIPAKFRRLYGMGSGDTVMLVGNPEQDGFGVLTTGGFAKMQSYLSGIAELAKKS